MTLSKKVRQWMDQNGTWHNYVTSTCSACGEVIEGETTIDAECLLGWHRSLTCTKTHSSINNDQEPTHNVG